MNPSVTDPGKPDSMYFSPSLTENLASPLFSEIINFTQPVCAFPCGMTSTYPAYIICLWIDR